MILRVLLISAIIILFSMVTVAVIMHFEPNVIHVSLRNGISGYNPSGHVGYIFSLIATLLLQGEDLQTTLVIGIIWYASSVVGGMLARSTSRGCSAGSLSPIIAAIICAAIIWAHVPPSGYIGIVSTLYDLMDNILIYVIASILGGTLGGAASRSVE